MNKHLERILEKVLSGRFIFTIVCAYTFAHLCITNSIQWVDAKEVILLVVYAYFTKQDNNLNKSNNQIIDGRDKNDKP